MVRTAKCHVFRIGLGLLAVAVGTFGCRSGPPPPGTAVIEFDADLLDHAELVGTPRVVLEPIGDRGRRVSAALSCEERARRDRCSLRVETERGRYDVLLDSALFVQRGSETAKVRSRKEKRVTLEADLVNGMIRVAAPTGYEGRMASVKGLGSQASTRQSLALGAGGAVTALAPGEYAVEAGDVCLAAPDASVVVDKGTLADVALVERCGRFLVRVPDGVDVERVDVRVDGLGFAVEAYPARDTMELRIEEGARDLSISPAPGGCHGPYSTRIQVAAGSRESLPVTFPTTCGSIHLEVSGIVGNAAPECSVFVDGERWSDVDQTTDSIVIRDVPEGKRQIDVTWSDPCVSGYGGGVRVRAGTRQDGRVRRDDLRWQCGTIEVQLSGYCLAELRPRFSIRGERVSARAELEGMYVLDHVVEGDGTLVMEVDGWSEFRLDSPISVAAGQDLLVPHELPPRWSLAVDKVRHGLGPREGRVSKKGRLRLDSVDGLSFEPFGGAAEKVHDVELAWDEGELSLHAGSRGQDYLVFEGTGQRRSDVHTFRFRGDNPLSEPLAACLIGQMLAP